MKDIQIGKEDIKLSLFTDDMIICVENLKESTTTTTTTILLGFISSYNKGAGQKAKYAKVN